MKVKHHGLLLKGRIISAQNNSLRVRLEDPAKYRGEKFIDYGFASAMKGVHIFKRGKVFSKDAIASARELLVQIYEEVKEKQANEWLDDVLTKLS